uniref:RING-type domain-containing protein n=1 Tax=Macrostomum lignano TaxID=282301 RepID=A0A1I8HFL6_9PLAT
MSFHGQSGIVVVNNKTYDLDKLSPEERHRVEHLVLHEKHRGHESMHMEMFFILIATLVVAQILLVQWRKYYFQSYQTATLLGMWIVPVFLCLKLSWHRFLYVWSVFSVITGLMTYWATRKPLAGTTPRRVYTWFLLCYKISYALGIAGYLVMMGALFGLSILFMVKPNVAMDFGLVLLFYGLYFGVVARDFAEVCSDKMASHIGYYTKTGMPTRKLDEGVCAVCGQPIVRQDEDEDGVSNGAEKVVVLNCAHSFHDFCIRGWCIVGKKQTCPYCKEKVDLKRMFPNPWEKPHILYGNLLDWIRYLVAWQPVIITLVQGINWALGLE